MPEQDKVIKKDDDENTDVEAHKVMKTNEEKSSEDETETPDVEAHKVQHKVQH